MNDIQEVLKSASEGYVETVKQYKWSLLPDTQLHAAKQALTKNTYIMGVAAKQPESVYTALMNAAILGLDLTEGKRQAWLVPRKNQNKVTEIVLQPGYKGVESIHQRMGVIDRCEIRTVYANDHFEWSGNSCDIPEHKCDWLKAPDTRGAPAGAFIVTYYPDGSHQAIFKHINYIYERHRAKSESFKSYSEKIKKGEWAYEPPWVTDEESMIEKTMIYIASKQWPSYDKNHETNSKILETLHEVESTDYTARYTPEQKRYFDELIEARDNLGLVLFDDYYGIEISSSLWLDLRSSIPRGQKDKTMSLIAEEGGDGNEILYSIKDALANEDVLGLKENIEGCLDITKKLLVKKLDEFENEKLIEMMNA